MSSSMELFNKQLWLWGEHGSRVGGQKMTKGGIFLVWCTQLHFKHSGRFLCYPSMVSCHILMGLRDSEDFSTFRYRAFSPRRLCSLELKSAKEGTVMGRNRGGSLKLLMFGIWTPFTHPKLSYLIDNGMLSL